MLIELVSHFLKFNPTFHLLLGPNMCGRLVFLPKTIEIRAQKG
jgi:hypothetical protein